MISNVKTDRGGRRLRRLSILVTILCVEWIALTLLYLGGTVFESLGLAAGAGVVYLAFPSLAALVVLTATGVRTAIRALAMRIRDKRTYRFSLRGLLLAVLLISIACAWYGHRVRRVRAERRMLEGKWRVVSAEGEPVILPTGKPVIVEFARGGYTVDPAHNPKWLDFHLPGGTSRAIYHREGTMLRVMQASQGLERPTSFDQEIVDVAREPGTKIRTFSVNTYLLERLPDPPERPRESASDWLVPCQVLILG